MHVHAQITEMMNREIYKYRPSTPKCHSVSHEHGPFNCLLSIHVRYGMHMGGWVGWVPPLPAGTVGREMRRVFFL